MANVKKILLRSFAGIGVFAASLGGAYFLTPNRVEKANFNVPTTNEQNESSTNLDNFIRRLSEDAGLNEEKSAEREYYGIVADFNNLKISFKKDADSAVNNFGIDGQLSFLMRGLKDINFSLNAKVDYNSYKLPLNITYVDKTAYLGLFDLKMKLGSTTLKELLVGESENDETGGLIYKYFNSVDTGIDFDLLGFVDDKLNNLIDGLYSAIDPSSMMSGFKMGELGEDEVGTGIIMSDQEIANGYRFNFTIQINKEDESTNQITSSRIPLHINTDTDYRMTKIELGDSSEGFSIGNLSVSGSLAIQTKKDTEEDHVVKAPSDSEYYVEVIKYAGWLQKLANFLDEDNQKFGFDFALDLNSLTNDGVTTTVEKDIGKLEGSINADFSEIIDISNYKYSESEEALSPKQLMRSNLGDDEEETLVSRIKNKASLYVNLDLVGQKGTKSAGDVYTNLAIAYENGEGYISLGDNGTSATMKAAIDTTTMNWLIEELPTMISSFGGEDNMESASSLFSFVTDSKFSQAIKSGDYSAIMPLISNLSNDESKVSFGLNLSTLGLGDKAKVELSLDSIAAGNPNNGSKAFSLSIKDIELGSVGLGVTLENGEYEKVAITNKESYDSLNFLPTVFDQVSTILQEKKTGFSVSGSLLDDNGLGITLSGDGQFDYGNKFGYGDLTIKQYKYHNDQVWYTHKIALDVDNTTSDFKANNAYFVYGDTTTNDNIKGRTTIQSLLDIVDVFSTFISDYKDDSRFTKFLEPLTKLLGVSELSNIIGAKDYFKLASNELVKSIKKTDNIVSLSIGGTLFKLDSDINIDIVLSDNKIGQINVNNLVVAGKKLNLSLAPTDYNENRVSSINHSWSFLDLSTISLLLKFGINTTVSNYYHIYAPITLNALTIFNVDFDLHVYIVVNGEYVKIYGIVEDALLVDGIFTSKLIQDVPVATSRVVSEFTFETYPDGDANKEDGVGGYFHFKTRCYRKFFTEKLTQTRHYVTTSKNLLEGNNLLTYLLQDFLLIQDGLVSKIGNISLESSSSEKAAGDFTNLFTSTGYQYDANNKKWKIGINLNEITGIDALKALELTLYGSDQERLSGLDVNLNIQASIAKISITAKLTLDTGSANQTDWSSSIQSSFAAINNVSAGDKLNNPNSYVSK